MIIWLASYPRSGNTLLRTVIKHCFGMDSFADEPVTVESEFRSRSELIGHREYAEPWEAFYDRMCDANEPVLVKTHLPPRDAGPFIYVVRDGRSAIQSYRKLHRDYNGVDKSLGALIMGDDAYGHWSGHFEAWNRREGVDGLVLRFHELVDPSGEILERISKRIGAGGPVRPWKNPVEKLAAFEPNFFNRKSPVFHPEAEWTALHQDLFDRLHGRLMAELGFYEAVPGPSGQDGFLGDMARTVDALVREKQALSSACRERLALIERLEGICEERLALIRQLHNAGEGDEQK